MERFLFFSQNVKDLRIKKAKFDLITLNIDADFYMIAKTNMFNGINDSDNLTFPNIVCFGGG